MAFLRGAGLALFIFAATPGAAFADPLVAEAQNLLNQLGYDAGPSDGAYGRRTGDAASAFFADRGGTYDGSMDEAEVAALRQAAAEYEPVLRHPGQLIDHTHGRATSCNALTPGDVTAASVDPGNYPPVPALNDAASIGESVLWNKTEPWVKAVVTLAALYDTRKDEAAGKKAVAMLTEWAEAKAITRTPVDLRYNGKGSAGTYRPSASAPVLDMENAAQLGYAVLYALEMLGDAATPEEHKLIANWAAGLVRKYGGPIGDAVFQKHPTGIWRLEGRPMLALAIVNGDAATYARYVNAYYNEFRATVNKDGAILKNANRGDRGMHYQSQGTLSMTALFDLVENQGGKVPRDLEEKLHAAVKFLLDADADNAVILPYSKEGYNNPGRGQHPLRYYRDNAEHYWWMIYYLSRFPDNENSKRLRAFLDRNDINERVASRVMSSVWVPYPINCYRAFDMSEKAVAEAKAFSANFKQPTDDDEGKKPEKLVTTKGAAPLAVASAFIREGFREKNFVQYDVTATGVTVGGDKVFLPTIMVFTDYRRSADEVSNIELVRLVFDRENLADEESRKANYLPCGSLAAKAGDDGRQQIRLHLGNEAKQNACILSKMSAHDRRVWASMLDGFGTVLASSASSDAATKLNEVYQYLAK